MHFSGVEGFHIAIGIPYHKAAVVCDFHHSHLFPGTVFHGDFRGFSDEAGEVQVFREEQPLGKLRQQDFQFIQHSGQQL